MDRFRIITTPDAFYIFKNGEIIRISNYGEATELVTKLTEWMEI